MDGSRGEELLAHLRASQAAGPSDPRRLAKKRERWYGFTNLERMLQSICANSPGDRLPPRLRRLFCAAVCRRIWHLMPDDECRQNIEIAEADADREVSSAEHSDYWNRLTAGMSVRHWPRFATLCALTGGCGGTSGAAVWAVREDGGDGAEEDRAHTDLLRDIIGEWFDPVAFASEWRTDTAVALARQMYDSRDFSAMPILGDALQDAGCSNVKVLDHCRAGQIHVRGCWVTDGVLGRRDPT